MIQRAPKDTKAETYIIFAFCVITALIPFLSINMPRSYAFVPAISSVLIFMPYFLLATQKPKISLQTTILVAAILAVSSLSLLWADYFETSKDKVLKLLILLPPQILLISLATSLSREQLKPLERFLPISFIVVSIFLIIEIVSKGILHDIVRGEPISNIADPDDFNRGSVALALYAFSIVGILSLKLKGFQSALIVFIPLTIAIFMSRSQSAQICIIIGLITFFLFPYKSKIAWKILKYMVLATILATPFVVSYVYDNFAQTLQDIPFMAQGYAGHRLELWDYTSRYALESPWLGYGIEATREVDDFESKHIFWPKSGVLHPHNFSIQIWMEFGLLGILIATGLMYALFTMIEEKFTIAQQKILLPTLIVTLIPASLAYGLWQGLWIGLMFHVAAIALMASTLANNEKQS